MYLCRIVELLQDQRVSEAKLAADRHENEIAAAKEKRGLDSELFTALSVVVSALYCHNSRKMVIAFNQSREGSLPSSPRPSFLTPTTCRRTELSTAKFWSC